VWPLALNAMIRSGFARALLLLNALTLGNTATYAGTPPLVPTSRSRSRALPDTSTSAAMIALRLTPEAITAGQSVSAEVRLAKPAPRGGVLVKLTAAPAGQVTMDASVVVRVGETIASVPITTLASATTGAVTITAAAAGAPAASAALKVTALPISNPVAQASILPKRAACGATVSFDASASTQASPHVITKYEWDFDLPDAAAAGKTVEQIQAAFTADSQGKTAQHRYSLFGTFHPVLRVTDDQGRIGLAWGDAVTVDQGNRPPMVNAGGPYVALVGQTLALDGSGTVEPDVQCGDKLVKLEWDLAGKGEFSAAQGASPVLVWQSLAAKLPPSSYPADPKTREPHIAVTLRATDTFGASATATAELRVYRRGPIALASWGPQPMVPLTSQNGFMTATGTVQLDGSASYDGHPDYRVVDWIWSVSGSTTKVAGQTAALPVTFVFTQPPQPGVPVSRTLVLTATNNAGESAKVSFDVKFARSLQ
jgi:hypothetical protein